MKRPFIILTVLILSLTAVFAVACQPQKIPMPIVVTFVQDGCENVVLTYNVGEDFVLPTPIQSSDNSIVTEWNVKDNFLPEESQIVTAVQYTKGLEFVAVVYNGDYCIKIDKYNGEFPVVIIPQYYKGYPVKILGERAFEDKNWVTKVVLPEGLEKVEYHPFLRCDNIVDVNIPSTLKDLKEYAFCDAHNYFDVVVPGGIDTLLDHAFFGYRGKFVKFGHGVSVIREYVFGGKNNLETVVLPTTVSEISGRAFFNQPLKSIFYEGNEEDFLFVAICDDKHGTVENLEERISSGKTTVYFYSENKPEGQGDFWHYKNGIPTIWD